MRCFWITDRFTELGLPPDELPPTGHLWICGSRDDFEVHLAEVQIRLKRWTGHSLVDLHISDLLSAQLPSHHDFTSSYDLMIFRRLAASPEGGTPPAPGTDEDPTAALRDVDTSPVGFAVFDRVLLSVHPSDCLVRDFFIDRLTQIQDPGNGPTRLPANPADLMLRMTNHMVDGYLELRRRLTRQLTAQQQELFSRQARRVNWRALLASRNTLHHLEEVCEDQRSAVQEWLDALAEWPAAADAATQSERELLRLRSRDVLEHIERVLSHVRRLESSVESAVQMHFSDLGQRTNEIMRTLTVLTAVFLPLNLITGIFGMNFDNMPLIHGPRGFVIALALMVVVVVGLIGLFWRRRYIGEAP